MADLKQPFTLYDLIAIPERELFADRPDLEAAPEVRRIYEALLIKVQNGETDPLDLEHDVILMRALVIDFINRWDDFSNALIAWWLDKRGHAPDKILDLSQAAVMLEQISRVVKRMHEIRQTTAINLAAVRELMDKMALVLARHVQDANLLSAISDDWAQIDIDLKANSNRG